MARAGFAGRWEATEQHGVGVSERDDVLPGDVPFLAAEVLRRWVAAERLEIFEV